MKIGVTISFKKGDSLFTNGIRQNVMNLAKILSYSSKQHDVRVVNVINYADRPDSYEWEVNGIKTDEYSKLTNEDIKSYDLWIILAVVPPLADLKLFRDLNPNCKIVSYKCGNNYQNFVEEVVYGLDQPTSKEFGANIYDEVWHIPQQDFNNKYFYSTLYRTVARLVPFVWDPMFVEGHANILRKKGKTIEYSPKQGAKSVGIFEPNLGMQKNAIAPMILAERLYHESPELIDKVLVTNSNKLRENKEFIKFVQGGFDLYNDKKMFFDSRYPIVHYLSSFTDVVLCHQWGNDLNYLYLDAMYYGYPLVHNAYFIQDAGYHYEYFDLEKGAQQLKVAITEYDQNMEFERQKNQKVLDRYRPEWKPMIEAYDMLIDNLWADDKVEEFNYNWKTNSYK